MKKLKETVKIIQITDTHLTKDNSSLFNVNTNAAFKKIMQQIQDDIVDTDYIIMTGDLSQDESSESYQMVAEAFDNIPKEIYWLPGNHDSIYEMNSIFEQKKQFHHLKKVSTKYWDYIFLDTKLEGHDSGFLSDNELAFLESAIKKEKKKSKAVIMHHHPIPVNTPLIDKYILKNHKDFLDIAIDGIDLIICGHVHGDYKLNYKGIHIETCPATCFQFKKGTQQLELDHAIGYKIHHFSGNSYVSETKIWKN